MPRFDVTIAGELNLDLILYGLPDKLPPERELLADRMMLTLGSSSAIVAHNLAALGSRVGFQSLIGEDSLGQIALDRLPQGGVDVSRVRRVQGSTTTGLTIILQRTGWRNILTYSGTIAELSLKDLDFDYLLDSRHFHLSSLYLQHALLPDVAELFRRVKAAGLTISLDTNDDPRRSLGRRIKRLVEVRGCVPAKCARGHEDHWDRRFRGRNQAPGGDGSTRRRQTGQRRCARATRVRALFQPGVEDHCSRPGGRR